VSQRGFGVIAKSSIPREETHLASFTFKHLLYVSCMLVLFAYSSLSFLQLAFGEFGLLELCRLNLFKFHIKILKIKRKLTFSSAIEHIASQKKRSSTDTDSKYKVHRSESTKSLSAKAYNSSYTPVTSEDEDVCPTCLEGLYSCIFFKE
jgi:hypothetical protein